MNVEGAGAAVMGAAIAAAGAAVPGDDAMAAAFSALLAAAAPVLAPAVGTAGAVKVPPPAEVATAAVEVATAPDADSAEVTRLVGVATSRPGSVTAPDINAAIRPNPGQSMLSGTGVKDLQQGRPVRLAVDRPLVTVTPAKGAPVQDSQANGAAAKGARATALPASGAPAAAGAAAIPVEAGRPVAPLSNAAMPWDDMADAGPNGLRVEGLAGQVALRVVEGALAPGTAAEAPPEMQLQHGKDAAPLSVKATDDSDDDPADREDVAAPIVLPAVGPPPVVALPRAAAPLASAIAARDVTAADRRISPARVSDVPVAAGRAAAADAIAGALPAIPADDALAMAEAPAVAAVRVVPVAETRVAAPLAVVEQPAPSALPPVATAAQPREDWRLRRQEPADASDNSVGVAIADAGPRRAPLAAFEAPVAAPERSVAPEPRADIAVASDRLGAVRIGIEGTALDLKVSLGLAPGAAAIVAADVPRLVADLAASGVRLQSLDIAGGGAFGGGQFGDAQPQGRQGGQPSPARSLPIIDTPLSRHSDRYA